VRHAGISFLPALARLSRQTARADRAGHGLSVHHPLLGKRIRTDIIGEQWDDVLRLVGSIKAGHVAPSIMLPKLAAYERQNQLDVALQEIGKIERTLFMLDWLENPDLRRRCHPGLNNSEQRHALTQAIYTFRQGRIIDRSHEAQQYRASGLNLVIAAIVIGTRSTWTPPLNICDQRRSRCLMIFLPYLPCWLGAYCIFGRFTPGSRRRFRWPQGPQSAAR